MVHLAWSFLENNVSVTRCICFSSLRGTSKVFDMLRLTDMEAYELTKSLLYCWSFPHNGRYQPCWLCATSLPRIFLLWCWVFTDLILGTSGSTGKQNGTSNSNLFRFWSRYNWRKPSTKREYKFVCIWMNLYNSALLRVFSSFMRYINREQGNQIQLDSKKRDTTKLSQGLNHLLRGLVSRLKPALSTVIMFMSYVVIQ